MKKLIVLAMLLVLVAGFAFADGISIGGWGRGVYAPVIDYTTASNNNIGNVETASWGWGVGPRVGIGISGTSEFVGFTIALKADSVANFEVNEEAYIWVKPVTGLKFIMGAAYDDTLRGNAGFGSYNWLRPAISFGDSFIFQRINENHGKSFQVSFAMSGFFISIAQTNLGSTAEYGATLKATDPINSLQIAAGYTIEGIGTIRAQKLPVSSTTATESGIQAAFKLTAVQNLYVDLGVTVPMNLDGSNNAVTAKVPVYANYKIAGATIHAGLQLDLYNGSVATVDPGIMGAVGVDYDLGFQGLALAADFRYATKTSSFATAGAANDMNMSMFVGITKGFSNGLVGVGFIYSSTSWAANIGPTGAGNPTTLADKPHFALPIRMEYWF